jgi:hypothetical protein
MTAVVTALVTVGVTHLIDQRVQAGQERSYLFTGTVAPNQSPIGIWQFGEACITPDDYKAAHMQDGVDWCGTVYPSAGISLTGLTAGLPVQVLVTNAVALPSGELASVRSGVVLPASAQAPGTVRAVTMRSQAETREFATRLIGLAEPDAITAATSVGFEARTTSVDGVAAIVTTEFNGLRINLSVIKGVVTKAVVG